MTPVNAVADLRSSKLAYGLGKGQYAYHEYDVKGARELS
jgi:hypothetical protein